MRLLFLTKSIVKLSIETIKKFSPDLFLMDGSLLVNPGDIPKKDTTLYSDYLEVRELLKKLYKISRENECLLVGIVEDSRSSIFCNFIAENILSKIRSNKVPELKELLRRTRDTNLLYYMLEKDEATRSIDLQDGIKCFYLKTAQFDRPIRVEYIDKMEEIARIIYTISSQNKTYGVPNVLIEADQRAKLSENETNYFISLIASKLRLQNIFFLRREGRPFT
ncbi:MAG TPA: DNA double-strand break repair nuclease NurA [Candidatus Aenigmarchaeota archaeon]|nr:DNA double-strand break repair nuclease NurA [Candidatus Aenigmarchaeota archaeon]